MGDVKDTKCLHDVVEEQERAEYGERVLPDNFLKGLRAALDAGLSCAQVTAGLIVMAGLYESLDHFDGDALVERSQLIMRVIEGHRCREPKCPRKKR